MSNISIDKQHTALLIADFYADMMGTLPHATSRNCVAKTQTLQEAARKAGILICYSATVFREGYPEISERNKSFSQRKHSTRPAIADPYALIHPAVKPQAGEIVVGKHRVNALLGNDLTMILGANNVTTLILLGFATSGVVLSTTRFASDLDYRLIIVEDCCADRDVATHEFLCNKILSHQADIVQSAEVIKALAS